MPKSYCDSLFFVMYDNLLGMRNGAEGLVTCLPHFGLRLLDGERCQFLYSHPDYGREMTIVGLKSQVVTSKPTVLVLRLPLTIAVAVTV